MPLCGRAEHCLKREIPLLFEVDVCLPPCSLGTSLAVSRSRASSGMSPTNPGPHANEASGLVRKKSPGWDRYDWATDLLNQEHKHPNIPLSQHSLESKQEQWQ